MTILKFGGTSMGNENTWRQVLQIITRYEHPFIIVSATSDTTRQLIKTAKLALADPEKAYEHASKIEQRHQKLITNFLANVTITHHSIRKKCQEWIKKQNQQLHKLIAQIDAEKEINPATMDAIASIGEQLSSYLFAQCGQALGLPTQWINAADVIRTNSDFGQATPDLTYITNNLSAIHQLSADTIPVMGGFYGQDNHGNITTLGFEGSDYSASLMGAALSADAIEIWTDVSGIYTCDPRVIDEAYPIPELSFQEATELAYFGAKVLHPSTTKPAALKDIPIKVKNIFDPDAPGTHISTKVTSNGTAKAMTFKEEALICTVNSSHTVMGYEFLANVFKTLQSLHLPVDVVTTTEASVSIAIPPCSQLETLVEQLQSAGRIDLQENQAIISIVGCNPQQSTLLIKETLDGIGEDIINMLSFSHAKRNLNVVLNSDRLLTAVKAIHRKIFT
ncbi:aspartate kinase [Fodinibius salsisoli]|uniref:Aspartokinase n=1 Tax=Fodinibius salsisoli TaxID=2820877 RepID=A0ABT3PJ94_9BACT|nr:aspartate kinase [Fodinibius salsisoli]MCW9706005.1 aspartate kinase [Fodinibius salsisoli]